MIVDPQLKYKLDGSSLGKERLGYARQLLELAQISTQLQAKGLFAESRQLFDFRAKYSDTDGTDISTIEKRINYGTKVLRKKVI